MIDKAELLDSLRARVREDLAALERRHKDVARGATHEESRAEHAKDTRATEQSYLARGLAERVANLRRTVEALTTLELRDFESGDPIGLTALVSVSAESDEHDGPTRETWFVVPGAGGLELESRGIRIRTVTPVSPLGQALLGLRERDLGEFRSPRGARSFEVLSIH